MDAGKDEAAGPDRARAPALWARRFERLGWVTFAAAVASVVGQRVWPLELFTHFWPQMALLLLGVAALRAFRGAPGLAALHALPALLLVLLVVPHVAWDRGRGEGGSAELVALFANVAREEDAAARLAARVREAEPDVVGLVEVDAAFLERLDALDEAYPYRVVHPRDDSFGVALLSRLPIAEGSVERLGASGLPTIFARVEAPSGPWRVVVAHPVPPFTATAFRSRNAQLRAIARAVAGDATPTVVIADLNATPWSPFARDFVREGALVSALGKARSVYTWPDGIPFLALSLDRCLHTQGVAGAGHHVLGSVGSDHFPVLCRFRGGGGAAAAGR